MPRQLIAILLIATIMAQSLVGLTSGRVLLCLGGGDAIDGLALSEPAARCESACGHDAGFTAIAERPAIASVGLEGHGDDGRCCLDLELTMPEWFAPAGHPDGPSVGDWAAGAALLPLADGLVLVELMACGDMLPDADDGPGGLPAVGVSTTRLLI